MKPDEEQLIRDGEQCSLPEDSDEVKELEERIAEAACWDEHDRAIMEIWRRLDYGLTDQAADKVAEFTRRATLDGELLPRLKLLTKVIAEGPPYRWLHSDAVRVGEALVLFLWQYGRSPNKEELLSFLREVDIVEELRGNEKLRVGAISDEGFRKALKDLGAKELVKSTRGRGRPRKSLDP